MEHDAVVFVPDEEQKLVLPPKQNAKKQKAILHFNAERESIEPSDPNYGLWGLYNENGGIFYQKFPKKIETYKELNSILTSETFVGCLLPLPVDEDLSHNEIEALSHPAKTK